MFVGRSRQDTRVRVASVSLCVRFLLAEVKGLQLAPQTLCIFARDPALPRSFFLAYAPNCYTAHSRIFYGGSLLLHGSEVPTRLYSTMFAQPRPQPSLPSKWVATARKPHPEA